MDDRRTLAVDIGGTGIKLAVLDGAGKIIGKPVRTPTPAAAMSALSDRLLDEVLLVGPAARCREQLDAFQASGATWATLGPQRVGEQDLLHQARLVASELAPR